MGLSTRSNTTLEFSIRQASAAGALILSASNLLRISILSQQRRWRDILFRSWPWLFAVLAIVILCQTRFFLARATFSQVAGSSIPLPRPVYSWGVIIYILYFLVGFANGQVKVAVRDRGIGLLPDEVSRVFEQFYRAAAARRLEGSGLGLYICQAIVAAHGGHVWATSAGPGKGTTFSFVLPIEPVASVPERS